MNKNSYTVCIICNDDRVTKWGYALSQTGHFARVCLVRSRYDFREILLGEMDGSLLAESDLPRSFDGVLFHSSNAGLWRLLSLKAAHTFEFNTPGDPKPQADVTPILRQTAPYFGIKPQDIEELSAYIMGQRTELPLCCTADLRPYILPSLACLFYLYFAQLAQGEEAMQPNFWQKIWREQSGANSSMLLAQEWRCQLAREWKYERRPVPRAPAPGRAAIEKLLHTFITGADSATPRLVNSAYAELCGKLGLPERKPDLPIDKPSTVQSILALGDRTDTHALAATLAYLWKVEDRVIKPTEETAWSMDPDALLVLNECQIPQLKRLRLQGFSGPVLIISIEPFQVLRQRHRVLRFGAGSHKSFPAPWDFEALLLALSNVVPLAPENLGLLQREIQASSTICQSYIDPCMEQLDKIDRSSHRVEEDDIEMLENVVGKIRAELPVVCHITITIDMVKGGQQKLQIQEHFQSALEKLQSGDMGKIGCGIRQFQAVFSQLQHYVLEAW